MIGSDTHNVVHMLSAQVCVKHSEMSGRTTERLVMRARPELILHEITNNYNDCNGKIICADVLIARGYINGVNALNCYFFPVHY